MEPLCDPLHDRVLSNLIPPPARYLAKNLLFPRNLNIPDLNILKAHLYNEGKVSKEDLILIVSKASQLLSREANLLELVDPVTIIGDIHGQFYDFLKVLDLAGKLPDTSYLFLGDYVDRGSFSIEVLLLLYSLKLNFPDSVHLLRGNHECRQLTGFFNFRSECIYKYDIEVYEIIMESFDYLPIACVVNRKYLCVHGGLSPELKKISDILKIDRNCEPPRIGIFCDLL